MLFFDRKNFVELHRRWLVGTTMVGGGCFAWLAVERWRTGHWPGPGSWPGLSLGVAAALIFLFEFALWPKRSRRFRTARRLGSAKTWMQAHIWLGLLSAPLFLMHCRMHFGGTYTAILGWLSVAVIASGIVGLLLQNWLPKVMLLTLGEETIHAYIPEVAEQFAAEANSLLELYVADAVSGSAASRYGHEIETVYVGKQRTLGLMRPLTTRPELDRPKPIRSTMLIDAVRAKIVPYLQSGAESNWLGTRSKNDLYLEGLRSQAPTELRSAIMQLKSLCDRRLQFDRQQRLDLWLRSWLVVHVPLSAALLVILAGHCMLAMRLG